MLQRKVIPAILEATQREAQRRLRSFAKFSRQLHLDVMDRRFVHTSSFGPLTLGQMRLPGQSTVHLMVLDPREWIMACRQARAKRIVVHVEATVSQARLQEWRKFFPVYLAINPDTPTRLLLPYINDVDGVQVMTVHPGQQGAPFIRDRLQLVRELRHRRPHLPISVDGGMNEKTIRLARAAGANEFIAGSTLTSARFPAATYKRLKKIAS